MDGWGDGWMTEGIQWHSPWNILGYSETFKIEATAPASWLRSPSCSLWRLWKETNALRGGLRPEILPVVSFSPPKTASRASDYMPRDSDLSAPACSAYHHLIPPLSALSLQCFPTVFRVRKFKFLRKTLKAPQIWLLHTFYFWISPLRTPSKSRPFWGELVLDLAWNYETSGNTKAVNFCEFTHISI